MKHISTIHPSPGWSESSGGGNDLALESLWGVLRGVYGNKAKDLGDAPNMGWKMALDGFSDDDIRRGIRAMMTEFPEWPPTAFEFAALCRGENDIAALDDGRLCSLAAKLGVKTIGRTDRDGIVRDVQREQARQARDAKLLANG